MKVNEWLKNSLFGSSCWLCAAPHTLQMLCQSCHNDLPWLGKQHCAICALPLESASTICAHCLQTPPHFDRCIALFRYISPIDLLISDFKYHGQLAAGNLLSSLLTAHPPFQETIQPDYLLPMPLHSSRLRERGFNQAGLLANHLAQTLCIPVHTQLCHRIRATHHQMSLNAPARKKNLRGAFHCTKTLTGKSVAIIDDVVTTMTTVNELAYTLRQQGATHIEVWCIARTPAF